MGMKSDTARPTSKRQAEILNGLIVACNDIARAQATAATIVAGADRRGELDIGAGRSRDFAAELGGLVRALGVSPARSGSTFELIRSAIHRINALVIGENTSDAYVLCERIEAKAERLYERASHSALPPETKTIILRQLAQVTALRINLRRLSMRG